MKKLLSFIMVLAIAAASALSLTACKGKNKGDSSPDGEGSYIPEATAETSVRIITANVAAPTDFEKTYILYKGQTPNDYTMRKRFIRLCTMVDYYSPDILMLQEVNGRGAWWDFLIDNEDSLIKRYPKYGYVGTTNLAGGTNGVGGRGAFYNQLYYNKNKFELVAGGTFFCRDDKTSPENPYSGDYEGTYNASNTTTCSWAVLRDKRTNVTAVYGTTHLCTRPDGAQCFRNYGQARNLTEGLYDIAEEYKWGDKPLPIVVGGDFNGSPTQEAFYSYPHMLENAHYSDSKLGAPVPDESGTARIFGKTLNNNGSRIDYIFHQGAEVSDYFVVKGTFAEDKEQTYCEYNTDPVLDGSQYDLTDHLPVYAKLKFNGTSTSKAPNDYVNPSIEDDEVINSGFGITASATKITFDTPELLAYVGNNECKGFKADIVSDGLSAGYCLRLSMPRSRIDPVISIDYGKLMADLNLKAVSANEYKRIKIEYRLSRTKSASLVHFGASTTGLIPISIGINTTQIPYENGAWNTRVFDFSGIDDAFWDGDFTYFGVKTGVGLMAGDGIYIKSIELLK
ncbi:MAG: endonuclease/exonuclease/phosphatase family protein [Clostridia bacterium]|nr:endonuclease/exonuclease/phosphatase family protein [Clostridia bacterium]